MSPSTTSDSWKELEPFLRREGTVLATKPRGGLVTVPAPRASPEILLEVDPGESAFVWAPPTGERWGGLSSAHSMDLDNDSLPTHLAQRAAPLLEGLEIRCHTLTRPPHARAFGGISFARTQASDSVWAPFGAGRFTLPRWSYHDDTEGASLTLAVLAGEPHEKLEGNIAQGRRIFHKLAAPLPAREHSQSTGLSEPFDSQARRSWARRVDKALEAIRSGWLEKVVLARRVRVRFTTAPEPAAVLRRLQAASGIATCFALREKGSTFLGATPELLVTRRADRVFSEAIAGSCPHDAAAAMLRSRKERLEHRLTVDGLVEALKPLCTSLLAASEPQLLELKNVTHLITPLRGVLAGDTHVLELVAALHPTPAIGGWPRDHALAWIEAHEGLDRGLYSGPVGWFDAHGEGEFRVALRSGLLMGREALLFAGAGLVAGSEPGKEFNETALKLQAMLAALAAAASPIDAFSREELPLREDESRDCAAEPQK